MKTETDKERADRLERELFQLDHAYNYIANRWQEEIDRRYSAYVFIGWLSALCILACVLLLEQAMK